MLVIKKSLNSSVLLVQNDKKKEFILMGKGIGFGRKPGEKVEENSDNQVFMPIDNKSTKRLIELIDCISEDYFELAQEIVHYAAQELNTTFQDNIYFLLTDHLSSAVDRYKNNTMIFNRVYWEIKNFYPAEFSVGLFALELLNKRLGINIPEDEAANIAFHLVNGQDGKSSQHNAIRAAKLISSVVSLVKYTTNKEFDTETIHYSRFLSHMQFFAERFFANKLLSSDDDFLYTQMEYKYPFSVKCANRVGQYIYQNYERELPKEEIVYLALHIQRLISET
ncbi:MAG TPA: transcription antiterminator BglG [Firmicutes bacterium]|nr:transcription antiterminator BglG [Bacillota bacterium]